MKKEGKKEKQNSSFFERFGKFVFFVFLAGVAFFLWLIGIALVFFGVFGISLVLFVVVLIAGIWIIKRKGFLFKFIAVCLFILVLIGFLAVLFYYLGSAKEVKGEERETILQAIVPMADSFLAGYNEQNYSKISGDFAEEIKSQTSAENFSLAYNAYGRYVSKGEAKVMKKNEVIFVEYKAEFEKASLKFGLAFKKIDEKYKISGYNFQIIKIKEKSTDFKIKQEKVIGNITTSKSNYLPVEGNEYDYFEVYLKNNNSFSIFVNKLSFNSVDNYIYGSIDFTKYPDFKEFCKPFELGEIKSYDVKEGCIIFQLPKDAKGELVVDIV